MASQQHRHVEVEGAGPPTRVFSTRRRLVAAFSVALAVFLLALAVQVLAFRRMEATFAALKELDEQLQLALRLESAVREQYAHQGLFVVESSRLRLDEYLKARADSLGLMAALGARLKDADALRWMAEIRQANQELDRTFQERVAPAAERRDGVAATAHGLAYPHVTVVEDRVDKVFARLREATAVRQQELVDTERTALRLLGVLAVAIPLFVAGAVAYLSRSVARPLAVLSRGAAAVSAGDLAARIDLDTPDEFGALAAEFNAMTVAVRQQQARLVESEKLAGIGRLAAGVAHELNNPLQVMLGYLSLNRDLPDRRLAGQLAATEDEALRCKRIVENLLELSRPTVDSAAVDLRGLSESVASGLRVALSQGCPDLSLAGTAQAQGDQARLRQVLFNLMRNAAEAAGPAGRVVVSIGARDGQAEVEVSDSGAGVAPECRGRLFEPFFTTKATGTGLGLAVSRAIALDHGGDIDVRDGALGGAQFTLRLPLAQERRT
jgi:two-component system, NtrC family, sensor kinase